jgi:hypothetical protein
MNELPNYRLVSTCANCEHCEDTGIDEEVLECMVFGWSHDYRVEHDFVCDLHKRRNDDGKDT